MYLSSPLASYRNQTLREGCILRAYTRRNERGLGRNPPFFLVISRLRFILSAVSCNYADIHTCRCSFSVYCNASEHEFNPVLESKRRVYTKLRLFLPRVRAIARVTTHEAGELGERGDHEVLKRFKDTVSPCQRLDSRAARASTLRRYSYVSGSDKSGSLFGLNRAAGTES
jgi:hypothetical protein